MASIFVKPFIVEENRTVGTCVQTINNSGEGYFGENFRNNENEWKFKLYSSDSTNIIY